MERLGMADIIKKWADRGEVEAPVINFQEKMDEAGRKIRIQEYFKRCKVAKDILIPHENLVLNKTAKPFIDKFNKELLTNIKSIPGLIFFGDKGVGKSTTAGLLVKSAIKKDIKSYFITADELLKVSNEEFEYIKSCKFIVLDDLGLNNYQLADKEQRIPRLIWHIDKNGIFIIITTQFDLCKWLDGLSYNGKEAFKDRLSKYDQINFTGESLRGASPCTEKE